MAHSDLVTITGTPVNLAAGLTAGDVRWGQNLGSTDIRIHDGATAPASATAGYSFYAPGAFFRFVAKADEGRWAWTPVGESQVALFEE